MTRNSRHDTTARHTAADTTGAAASTAHNGRARTLERKAARARKTFAQTMGA